MSRFVVDVVSDPSCVELTTVFRVSKLVPPTSSWSKSATSAWWLERSPSCGDSGNVFAKKTGTPFSVKKGVAINYRISVINWHNQIKVRQKFSCWFEKNCDWCTNLKFCQNFIILQELLSFFADHSVLEESCEEEEDNPLNITFEDLWTSFFK